jgi:hypothetical protein
LTTPTQIPRGIGMQPGKSKILESWS